MKSSNYPLNILNKKSTLFVFKDIHISTPLFEGIFLLRMKDKPSIHGANLEKINKFLLL